MATIDAYYSSVYSNSGWNNPSYVQYNDTNWMDMSTTPATVIYEITNTIPSGGETTSITFYVDAKEVGFGAGGGSITVSLYIDGVFYPKTATPLTISEVRYNYTWTGSWLKGSVDAMRFRIVGSYSGTWVSAVEYLYCTQTYTPAPIGYDKVINDISGYTHINDIAIADITAWNDVT